MKENLDERMMELLCDKALSGLSEEELRELAEFEERTRESEGQSLELTAAKLSTLDLNADAELPAHLYEKIREESKKHVGVEKNIFTAERPAVVIERGSASVWNWLGWAVAAAACVALAVNLYIVQRPVDVGERTPAEKRRQLIESQQALVKATWQKGNVKASEGISGDVVWSDTTQTGYMRISGLPVNDPDKQSYQLWIFDETQSEKTPIDGGVFNVSSDGEVIIPIDAKLKAKNPNAFAITIEKPGGVVVSERDKLAGLAPVKPSQT